MNYRKIISLLCLLGCYYTHGMSQIKFKISLLNDIDLYQISLVSEQDFAFPDNIIGTAQISIKAPVVDFELDALTNLMDNVQWENNSVIIAPEEAKDFQYLSFALTTNGISLPLQKDVELPLFTFKNKVGKCSGRVYLVDNETDVFLPPNSREANIGNQITTLAGNRSNNQNAYSGNILEGIADCALSTNIAELASVEAVSLDIYPNPAKDWINVIIQSINIVSEDRRLQLRKMDGSMLQEHLLNSFLSTKEVVHLNIDGLAAGEYMLHLIQNNKILTKKFIKIEL